MFKIFNNKKKLNYAAQIKFRIELSKSFYYCTRNRNIKFNLEKKRY